MTVFLLLTTLSVVFYFVVLLALYRDSHTRQRTGIGHIQALQYGGDGYEREGLDGGQADAVRFRRPTQLLWVPVTRVHWKPVLRPKLTTQQAGVSAASSHASGD